MNRKALILTGFFIALCIVLYITYSDSTSIATDDSAIESVAQPDLDQTTKTDQMNHQAKSTSHTNDMSSVADKTIIEELTESYHAYFDEDNDAENLLDAFFNEYGTRPELWTSSEWVYVSTLLTDPDTFHRFMANFGSVYTRFYNVDKEQIILCTRYLDMLADIIDNPYDANRILIESSDIKVWFLCKEEGRNTKKYVLERMDADMGYDRKHYIYIVGGIMGSYGDEQKYEDVAKVYDEFIRKIPQLTPDEKFSLLESLAHVYVTRKEVPNELRRKAFEIYQEYANDMTISHSNRETAEFMYTELQKYIEEGRWNYE